MSFLSLKRCATNQISAQRLENRVMKNRFCWDLLLPVAFACALLGVFGVTAPLMPALLCVALGGVLSLGALAMKMRASENVKSASLVPIRVNQRTGPQSLNPPSSQKLMVRFRRRAAGLYKVCSRKSLA